MFDELFVVRIRCFGFDKLLSGTLVAFCCHVVQFCVASTLSEPFVGYDDVAENTITVFKKRTKTINRSLDASYTYRTSTKFRSGAFTMSSASRRGDINLRRCKNEV